MLSWRIDLDVLEVQRSSDFESAFTAAQQRRIGAMLILSSPPIPANLQTLSGLSGGWWLYRRRRRAERMCCALLMPGAHSILIVCSR